MLQVVTIHLQKSPKGCAVLVLILQKRGVSQRSQSLAQGHTANKWGAVMQP